MAKVIQATSRHNCREEIAEIDGPDLYLGSVVECSCGKRFTKRNDQRDGDWWEEIR
jgi:hypothetical protein